MDRPDQPPASPVPVDRDETYLRLLAEHERALAAYVYSLVNSPADAADILQECKLSMWRMFDRFEPGTDFRAWGRKIAIHQILNFRRAAKRRPDSPLDQAFIEAVGAEIERRSDLLDRKADVLRLCLRKLPEEHRAVVVWRYYDECEVDEIAAKSDRTTEAVYRLLSRIRKVLNDCISRNLGAGAAPAT
jgi:RNA polymerase sigma-70 factor (ECF subfamily)